MSLPVVFHVFGLSLPAHLVFETLAYAAGFRLYLWLRKARRDDIDDRTRLTVMAGAILGAAIGSKLLGFAEHPELWSLANPAYALAAKSILGALLGGTIGVELAKAMAGVTRSTGDVTVFPLLTAIMIGRIGCLLTGVLDGTWGSATHFVLGFDAGDGVIRHPTPLYEILFLAALGGALLWLRRKARPEGDLFKVFLMAYCAWRFLIEFIKPVTTYDITPLNIVQNAANVNALASAPGLSLLQLAALGGLLFYTAWFANRAWRGRAHGVA